MIVPSASDVLTVVVTGDPAAQVALITPSAVIIDASTVDSEVAVEVFPGLWSFTIINPEAGSWDVKSDISDPTTLGIYWDVTPSAAVDVDADGFRDSDDNCPSLSNSDQVDTDSDGEGDACDSDDDDDTIDDVFDNCPDISNVSQQDTDGNGQGDACDPGGYQDFDSDGFVDNLDNCVVDANLSQANYDGDVLGDACDDDDDSDGCTDSAELGDDETLGGLRDPLNEWDFYDVLGPGAALPTDGIIDLPNDILGVIQRFSPLGTEPEYDVRFDRGPSTGPNPWNMTAPDGVIDLPNDILGVILQFNHSCQ